MPPQFSLENKGQNQDAIRFRLKLGDQHLSFRQVFEAWVKDPEFVDFYTGELSNTNFEAFFWEHPAIGTEFLDKPYECVVLRSKRLGQLPTNEEAFAEKFHGGEDVVDFLNLGKNARLVAPTRKKDADIYGHLGNFLRGAEKAQIGELFRRVGNVVFEELEKQGRIWLSTAGMGVIWLHIRMDTRPKYYKTKRYKDPNYLEEGK